MSDDPSPSQAEEAYGAAFLREFRSRAKRVDWHYETLQKIKTLDQEQLIKFFNQQGGLTYEAIQQIRKLSAEELAEYLISLYEKRREAAALSGGIGGWISLFNSIS